MDTELKHRLDEIDQEIIALTTLCQQIDQRLGTPQPRVTTPSYMSGRWWRRDGTAYGQPI